MFQALFILFSFFAITLFCSKQPDGHSKIINQSFKQPDDVSLLQGEKVRGVPTDRSWGRGIVCERRGSGVCARNIFSACIDSRRRTVGPEGGIWLLLQLRHRVRWVYPSVHCYSSSPTEDLWACLEVGGGVTVLEGWISHVLLCEWKMGRFKSPASSIQDILLCLSLFLTTKAMHEWLPVAENSVSVFPHVFLHIFLFAPAHLSVCVPTDSRRTSDSLPICQISKAKSASVINEHCFGALGMQGLKNRLSLYCHRVGSIWLMAETDKLQTSQAHRLSICAILLLSGGPGGCTAARHAKRLFVVIFHLRVPATSLGPILWLMGVQEVAAPTPPHVAWNAQNKRIHRLHRDWTHWLDIWEQTHHEGLCGQIGVKRLTGPSVLERETFNLWGDNTRAFAEFSLVACKGIGNMMLAKGSRWKSLTECLLGAFEAIIKTVNVILCYFCSGQKEYLTFKTL